MIGKIKFEVSETGMVISGKNKDVRKVMEFLAKNAGNMTIADYCKQALSYKRNAQ
jgi:hypothetical protein